MANYDISLNIKANADFSAVNTELQKLSRQQKAAAQRSSRSVPVAPTGGAQRVIQERGAGGARDAGAVAGADIALQAQQRRALGQALGVDLPELDTNALKREATANLRNQLKGLGLNEAELKNAVSRFQRSLNKTLEEATATIQSSRTASATARDIYNRAVQASGVGGIPQAETRKAREVFRDYDTAAQQQRLDQQLARQREVQARRADKATRDAEVERARLAREENAARRSGGDTAASRRARDEAAARRLDPNRGDVMGRQNAAQIRRLDKATRDAEVERARQIREENKRRRAAGETPDYSYVGGPIETDLRNTERARRGRPDRTAAGGAGAGGGADGGGVVSGFFADNGGGEQEPKKTPYESAAAGARGRAASLSGESILPGGGKLEGEGSILEGVKKGDQEFLVQNKAIANAVATYVQALIKAAEGLEIRRLGLERELVKASASAALYSQQLLNSQTGVLNANRDFISSLVEGRVLQSQQGALVAEGVSLSPEFADAEARRRISERATNEAIQNAQLGYGENPEDVLSRQQRIASGRLAPGDEAFIAAGQARGFRGLTQGVEAAVTLQPDDARQRIAGLQGQLDAYERDLRTAETLVINDDAARAKIQALIQQAQVLRGVLSDVSGLYAGGGTPDAGALAASLQPIRNVTPPPTPGEQASAAAAFREEQLIASRIQRRIPAGEPGAGQFIASSQFIDDLGRAQAIQQYIAALTNGAAAISSANRNFTNRIAEAGAQVAEYKAQVQNQTNQLLNANADFIQGQAEASVLRSERRAAVGEAVVSDPDLAAREAKAQLDRQEVLRQQREAVLREAQRRGVAPESLRRDQRQALFAQGVPSLTGVEEVRYAAAQGREISRLGKSASRAVFELDPATAIQSLGEIDSQLTRLEKDLVDNKLIINDAAARATIEADILKVKELRTQLGLARAELATGNANQGVLEGIFGIGTKNQNPLADVSSQIRQESQLVSNLLGQADLETLTNPFTGDQNRQGFGQALADSQQRLNDLRGQADTIARSGDIENNPALKRQYTAIRLEILKAEQAQASLAKAISNPRSINALERIKRLIREAGQESATAKTIVKQADPAARAVQLADLKARVAALDQAKIDIDTTVDPAAARELTRLETKLQQLRAQIADLEAGRPLGGGGGGGRGPVGPGGPGGPSGPGGGGRSGERGDLVSRLRQRGGAAGFFGTGALSTIRYGLPSLLLYGALGGVTNAIREAEEFQFNLTKIDSQITETFGPESAGLVDDFKQNILDLAQETGLAADEIAKLSTQLIGAFAEAPTTTQGGPRPEGVGGLEFVEQQAEAAAKIAQVTALPLNEITDGLTAASFAFGATFEEIGNVAVNLESKTGTLARETISFIGDIAPVAQEAGFSLEEFAAIAAVAQQRSGRSGTALAESFGRIIPRIRESRLELAAIASESPEAFSPDFFKAIENQDPRGILLGIGEAYDELDQKTRDRINIQLGGSREAQALIPALAQGQRVIELAEGAKDSAGQLQERFDKVSQTLTVQLQKLAEEAREFVLILLEAGLGDVFTTLIDGASLLLNIFKELLGVFKSVNDVTGGTAAILLGIAGTSLAISKTWKLIAATNIGGGLADILSVGGGRNAIAGAAADRAARTSLLSRLSSFLFVGGLSAQTDNSANAAKWGQQYQQARSMGIPVPTGAEGTQAANTGAAVAGRGRGAFGRPTLGKPGGLSGATLTPVGAVLGLAGAYGALSTVAPDIFSVEQARDEASEALKAYDQALADKIATARKIVTTSPSVLGLEAGSTASDAEVAALEESLATAAEGDDFLQTIAAAIAGEQSVYDRTFDALQEAKARRQSELLSIVGSNNEVESAFAAAGAKASELLNQDNFNELLELEVQDGALVVPAPGQVTGTTDLLAERRDRFKNTGNEILDAILGEFVINQEKSVEDVLKLIQGPDPLLSLKQASDGGDELAGAILAFVTERDFFNSEATRLAREQLNNDAEWVAKIEQLEAGNKALVDLQRRFQAGSISWSQYQRAVKENNFNALVIAQKLASEGEDNAAFLEQWAMTAAQNAEAYNKIISSLQGRIDSTANLFASTPQDYQASQERLISQLNIAVADPQLLPEQSEEYAKQLIQALQAQQSFLISTADSAEEILSIVNQGVDVPVSAKIAFIKNSLEIIGVNWQEINTQFVLFFGQTLDSYLQGIFDATDGSIESVRQILVNQINFFNAVAQQKQKIAETLRGGFFGFKLFPDDLINSLLDEANKATEQALALFYALLGVDATGNVDQAKADIEAARRSTQSITTLRKSSTGSQFEKNQADIEQAIIDQQLATQTPETEDDDREALAALNEARKARRRLFKNLQDSERSNARALADYIGDSVLGANIDLVQAEADLAFAIAEGDELEIAAAVAANIKARKAVRDAFLGRVELLSDLAQAQTRDPLEQANIELELAKRIEASALSEEERIKAQIRVIDANKKVEEAMRNIREAQFNVRKAELDAIEDSVGSAQVEVARARALLSDAINNNLGQAAIDNARAGVIATEKAARDAIFQNRMDDYKFLLDMGEITQSQYADYLEGLKSTLIPGTKQFKDLEVTIKQLRDDIGGNLQANLPTSLQLPTLYEVRRLNQMGQGAASGQAIGYQDNRNVQVTVYVNNGMTEDQVVGTLSKAMNVGTTGLESRRY